MAAEVPIDVAELRSKLLEGRPLASVTQTLAALQRGLAAVALPVEPRAAARTLNLLDEALVEPEELAALGARGERLANLAELVDEDLADSGLVRAARAVREGLTKATSAPATHRVVAEHGLPSDLALAVVASCAKPAELVVYEPPIRLADTILDHVRERAQRLDVAIAHTPLRPPQELAAYRLPTTSALAAWCADLVASHRSEAAHSQVEVVCPPRHPIGDLVVGELGHRGLVVADERSRTLAQTALGRLALDAAVLAELGSLPGAPAREQRLARLGVPRSAAELVAWLERARVELTQDELRLEPDEDAILEALCSGLVELAGAEHPAPLAALVRQVVALPAPRTQPEDATVRVVERPTPRFGGHRIVLAADADTVPAPIEDDPVLPLDLAERVRPSLGPTAAGLDAWYRAALLVCGAASVCIGVAAVVGSRLVAPSPLLEDLGLELRDASAPQHAPSPWVERAHAIGEARALERSNPWRWSIGAGHLPERLSVSAVEEAASCGARFALRYLLGVRARDPEARAVPHWVLGQLAHAVLEHSLQAGLEGACPDEAQLAAHLVEFEQALDEDARRTIARDPLWQARREDLARVLARALRDESLAPRGEITTEVAFELELGPTTIAARFDRLERAGAHWHVLDYKLAASPPASWPLRETSRPVQLALYRLLALEGHTSDPVLERPSAVSVGWALLRGRPPRRQEPRLPDPEEVRGEVVGFLDRLATGELSLDPTGKRNPCRLCRAEIACGVLQRDATEVAAGPPRNTGTTAEVRRA